MTKSTRWEIARYMRNLEDHGWAMARVDMVAGRPDERLIHIRLVRDSERASCTTYEQEDFDVCPTCGGATPWWNGSRPDA